MKKSILLAILVLSLFFPVQAFCSGAMEGGGASSGLIKGTLRFSGSSVFTDGDTDPSVASNSNWSTANTNPTTINKLDDLVTNELGVIYINDSNTTFDCTSSNLICNGGSDYTASSGELVFYFSPDGTNALLGITTPAAGGADPAAIHDNVAGEIAVITGKASPVDADMILIEDSAASNSKKMVTLTNLWSNYLKTKADALYIGSAGVTFENLNTNSDVGTGADQVAAGNHTHSGVYEPVDATILRQADVDDTPVNGVTTAPVSSNWAYDHAAAADPHTGYMLESNIGTGANNYIQLSATPGTPDGTKFLRDDGTWVTPAGGGDVSKVGIPAQYEWGEWTGDGTLKGTAVTGSKVVCTDANGSPTACSNLTDLAFSSYLALSGGTLTNILITDASDATASGLRLPHGVAPSSPTNGDLWTTTAGLYARINGATVGPFVEAAGSTEYNSIGDPSASGSISFAAYTGTYVSTTDGWGGLIVHTNVANNASPTTLLTLQSDDVADTTNVHYLTIKGDVDGTPVTFFDFKGNELAVGPTAAITGISTITASTSIGTAAAEIPDYYGGDGHIFYLGNDQEVTLTHVADTGVLLNAAMQLQFRDSAIHIASADDGHLDLTADTSIDLNGAVVASSSIAAAGVITGLVNTSADPANLSNFNGSFTVSAVGSTSLPLPTAVAGYSVCIRQGQGRTDTLSATPASGDYIVKDGVRGTAATAISSGGAATDKACFTAVDDTDWYMDYTGTWGE